MTINMILDELEPLNVTPKQATVLTEIGKPIDACREFNAKSDKLTKIHKMADNHQIDLRH